MFSKAFFKKHVYDIAAYAGLAATFILFLIFSRENLSYNVGTVLQAASAYAILSLGAVFVYSMGFMDVSIGQQIGVYSIDASPAGKQALLDGEFSAVAAQVPLQIAEYSFNQAVKYLDGETDLGDAKVYLDSHLVDKEEAEETLDDWQ